MSRKMISIFIACALVITLGATPVQAGTVPRQGLATATIKAAAPKPVSGATQTMTVAAGDWMSKIAKRLCGSANRWPEIARANPQIRNPNLIYPGQSLLVPCASKTDSRLTAPRASRSTPRPPVARWIKPLGAGLAATSCYGWRASTDSFHEGLDIPRRTGTPIRAVASGTVVHAGWNGGYGLQVVVKHQGAVWTRYAHSSRVAVQGGQTVRAGQVIAYVGSTGNSTGPHLHFEVYLGTLDHSHDVNPAPWLRARGIGMGC